MLIPVRVRETEYKVIKRPDDSQKHDFAEQCSNVHSMDDGMGYQNYAIAMWAVGNQLLGEVIGG